MRNLAVHKAANFRCFHRSLVPVAMQCIYNRLLQLNLVDILRKARSRKENGTLISAADILDEDVIARVTPITRLIFSPHFNESQAL